MELRVLSGPQAGCRLPLGVGTYRAGADETCDVVLEGLSGHETVFVIYVGQRSLGLESLSDGLRLAGRAVSGLVPLDLGQVFELGPWLFAVDDPQTPWPEDPESLRAKAHADAESLEARDDEDGMSQSVDASTDAVDAASTTGESHDGAQPDQQVPRSIHAAVAPASASSRRNVPFWVIGLAGTAAFLICGVVVLVMSLAPAQPASAAGSPGSATERIEKLAAASGGEVKLEHLAGGRVKLAGTLHTRAEKLQLTREARAIDPGVLLQVSTDEDLAALARDALSSFPPSGIELGHVDRGRLLLTGRVAESKLREQIVAALWDGVPGLVAVDSQVIAGDEVLASLGTLLNDAGLAKKVTGALDPDDASRLTVRGVLPEADAQSWLGVRQKLESHFGAALVIVEELRAPGSPPPSASPVALDVVAVVKGPMPYMLLRDGTKRALPAGAGGR